MENTPEDNQASPAETKAQTEPEKPAADYSMSGGFVGLLNSLNIAIAVTSYQSGRLYLLSRNPKGGLMVNEQMFNKAMGLAMHGDTLLMATLANIFRMENVLNPGQWIGETFTHCYLPRTGHFTGVLDAHDVGMTKDGDLLFVNTRYNCIAATSQKHSFRSVWKPPFVSKIVAEDRCHLNGMAMHDGEARYATAVSRSDTIDGWRDRRSNGGVVIDIKENRVVCEGLSMPHSPRVHQDKLWLLNSGTGELGWVDFGADEEMGVFKPLTFCPGFVRGLSFHGNFAFVGLSRPRYKRFEGLALDQTLQDLDSEPWCGVQVIDLTTGSCVQWFRIDGEIGELYDVAVMPNVGCAKSIGFATKDAFGLITVEEDEQ